jgi:hypothetical protein
MYLLLNDLIVIAVLPHNRYFCFLFTCVLLNDDVGGFDCVALNVEIIDEWWTEKDLEGTNKGHFLRKVSAFM